MYIKKLIKILVKKLGYRLIKLKTPSDKLKYSLKDTETLMAINNAKGILHLGAHKGTEAEVYNWFGKKVIWIEAIPYIYDQLKENIYSYKNQKAFCALLGDQDDIKKNFNISNNDGASSSVYKFSKNTLSNKYFPNRILKMEKNFSLIMNKLDTIIERNKIIISEYDHWVVDLQGAELLALKGAIKALKDCKTMNIEVSKVDIYEGGDLWDDLKLWLNEKGFFEENNPESVHTDILFKKNIKTKEVI